MVKRNHSLACGSFSTFRYSIDTGQIMTAGDIVIAVPGQNAIDRLGLIPAMFNDQPSSGFKM
jgi:hypothetical protein